MTALAKAKSSSRLLHAPHTRLVLVEEGASTTQALPNEADPATTAIVSAEASTLAGLVDRVNHCMANLRLGSGSIAEVVYLMGGATSEVAQERRITALAEVSDIASK